MKRAIPLVLISTAALCAGCGAFSRGVGPDYVKPTIAVMKFDCRAGFPLDWDIGAGMQDVLVDRLVATGRFRVVERPEISTVLRELEFQHSGATRHEKRAQLGRLKNAQFLIKGTVTDFGHVSRGSGFLGLHALNVFHASNVAVMGVTMYVVDVESGEIIASESIEEKVRASDTRVKLLYNGIGFGGSEFYQTPLGRATAKVIDRAIRRISKVVASQPWRLKIALVRSDGTVIVNGGTERRVKADTFYNVLERGDPVIDPDTGDVIGHQPGRLIGQIEIRQLRELYSVGRIVSGEASGFQIGQFCREVPRQQAP